MSNILMTIQLLFTCQNILSLFYRILFTATSSKNSNELKSRAYIKHKQQPQYATCIWTFFLKKGVTVQQSSRVRNTGFTIASVERRCSPTSCDIKVGQRASRLRVVPIFHQGQQSARRASVRENHPTRERRDAITEEKWGLLVV